MLTVKVTEEKVKPSQVWQPKADSVQARAIAAAPSSTLPPPDKPPLRLSHSPYIAKSMGHALLATEPKPLPPMMVFKSTQRETAALRRRPLKVCLPTYEGPLFEREIRLPVHASFVWPRFTRFAFYEDLGNIREAWSEMGYNACSVADRPTQQAPSKGCYHFIGQVYDFVHSFPHPIDVQTSHVECGPASWSSWKTWPSKLADKRMLEAAEELLWISCIGNRSVAEQPHTAHESNLGPPTQVANANEHGGHDKTWCLWRRNVGLIAPSDVVPEADRAEILSSATGSKEQRMLQRSRTSMQMARALVHAIDAYIDTALEEPDRPAAQPCQDYNEWRRALHHNIGVLAASFAPKLPDDLVDDTERAACAYILPLAPGQFGPLYLVPLQGSGVFGVELAQDKKAKEQAEEASRLLSVGIETHHMHDMHNSTGDIVVAVPWDVSPVTFIDTVKELDEARSSGMPAVWASTNALEGTAAFLPAMYASLRCAAMSGPVMADHSRPGIWTRARPAILSRRAEEFGTRGASDNAEQEWAAFMGQEEQRRAVMQEDLLRADNGSGLIEGFRSCVRTAADYTAELPAPAQGLPLYVATACLFVSAPQRPPPLIREWLHRLPPQAVPPGFQPLRYEQILRGWARRITAQKYNYNIIYDGFCFEHGETPENLLRPGSVTFGRNAAKLIKHADGVGSYNAFDLLLELRDDGLYHPVDFEKPEKRVWVFKIIEEYLGSVDNQEILSFLFHGVCWKVNMRGQLHVSRNLERYNARAPAIAKTIEKLAKNGYVDIVPICTARCGISSSTPPFLYIPQNHVPVGGIDKPDGTARVVGDMSDPHQGQRLRESENGPPDGELARSLNELSGPKGQPKPSYQGPLPFPEPETKPRPKHKYAALIYLRKYAHENRSFVVTMDDDMRQMFYQFFIREEDLYTCVWYIMMMIDGKLWLVAVRVRTMNMGGRNASKIACNFAEEWLDCWRRQMDGVVEVWLPKQSKALQKAYAARKSKLGSHQARPFWAAVYTDNFDFSFCASDLAALGTMVWRQMNARAGIELQSTIIYGTCTDWIGGRFVLQGGFGCLTPSKRTRAIEQCQKALAGNITREEYESNNSFLGHVADICAWPAGTLQGITGPLMRPGFDDDLVKLTEQARERYRNAIVLLESRCFASFHAGVQDAYEMWSGRGSALLPIRTHASDCCTDPQPHESNANPAPHVAGFCEGYFWRYKLEGEWLKRHITLTEATGPCLNALMTVPKFPDDINVLNADATAAIAAGTGRAKAAHTQLMQRELEKCISYKKHADSCWYDHWAGWGNGIIDLISRDNLPMARRLAAAFGIKLTELKLSEEAYLFMNKVLEKTAAQLEEHSMFVDIRGLDGRPMKIKVPVDASATDLLKAYGAAIRMPRMPQAAKQLRCLVEGHPLQPNDRLESYGTANFDARKDGNFTVHVVFNAGAGGLQTAAPPPAPLLPQGLIRAPSSTLKLLLSPMPLDMASRAAVAHATSATYSAASQPLEAYKRTSPTPVLEQVSKQLRTSPRMQHILMQQEQRATDALFETSCASPQPTSAASAIAMANDEAACRLAANTSRYAICPDNPLMLQSMIREAGAVEAMAIPKGTQGANEWGFQKVRAFAQSMGPAVRWMRPKLDEDHIDTEQEVWFTSLALLFIAQHMSPSARRKARGYGQAQPTSALLAIYGWQRVLRACNRYTCASSKLKGVLFGLCQRYKHIWGQDAFVKQQAKIFSRRMLLDMAAGCEPGAMPEWSRKKSRCCNAQLKYVVSLGARTDEFTKEHEQDDCLKRANITLVDQNTMEPIEVNEANLRRVKRGHLIRGISASSKCDRLNVEWSKQHQWFRYDPEDPLNFAVAWVTYELECPCAPEDRLAWPAFSTSGDAVASTSEQFARQHKELCVATLGAKDAEGRTPHGHRATLASGFAEARASGKHPEITDAVIQMHLRWKTLASLMSYVKTKPSVFADTIQLGTSIDAGTAIHDDTPVHEPDEVVDELIATIGALSGESSSSGTKAAKRAVVGGEPQDKNEKRKANGKDKAYESDDSSPPDLEIRVAGDVHPVIHKGHDTWGLVGTELEIPDALWNYDGDTTTLCTVSHYLGKYKFPEAGTHHAYTLTPLEEAHANYAVKADYLLRVIAPTKRAQLRKIKLGTA